MLSGELKPLLTLLVLPPAAPLLLALLGVLLAGARKRLGLALVVLGLALAWLTSLQGFGLLLARALTPAVAPVSAQQLREVQAIVVLGGGVDPYAPQYGAAQLSRASLERLRYGAFLARHSGKPLAFSGGLGWAGLEEQEPEAVVAGRVLAQDYGLALRWAEDRSRDTEENADFTADLLRPAGVRRIALVTDAIHLPRAAAEFRRAGFEVLPAPSGFAQSRERPVLRWLPSADGVGLSRYVLREWLGRQVAGLR